MLPLESGVKNSLSTLKNQIPNEWNKKTQEYTKKLGIALKEIDIKLVYYPNDNIPGGFDLKDGSVRARPIRIKDFPGGGSLSIILPEVNQTTCKSNK
jgi:hypothetical protein